MTVSGAIYGKARGHSFHLSLPPPVSNTSLFFIHQTPFPPLHTVYSYTTKACCQIGLHPTVARTYAHKAAPQRHRLRTHTRIWTE